MSHLSDRDLAMTDRWIAECRRILAEARERREGQHLRTAPHRPPTPDPSDIPAKKFQPDVTPEPVDTWTPTSVLDDIPPGPEPDEEDWRR